jgi:hypothetical protein
MFLFRNQFPSFIKYKFIVYNFLVFNLFFMCASQHLIFMEVLNVDLGDVYNQIDWKAK